MISIDRRYFLHFDWISFGLMFTITSIGILFVYSSTYTLVNPFSIFFQKQLYGFCSGLCIYFIFCFKDSKKLCRIGYFIFLLTILLLLFTLIKGKIGMGAKRWIDIKILKFQPSELAKLFLPAFITYYLTTEKENITFSFSQFTPILLAIFITSILILKQPDLGTTIIFLLTATVLIWLAGISNKFFIISLLLLLLTTPITWKLLKPYQKQRIEVFLGAGDIKKERYQIEQSTIAIGSGSLMGKGFLKGTQNKLMFLPEGRTDFIFSVICEEWGLYGALLIMTLYILLFIRLLIKISMIPDFFLKLLGIGLIIHIIFSMIINCAMVCGIMPIVGIPLPLISYGVSSLWITLASLGWIQGITMRTFLFK